MPIAISIDGRRVASEDARVSVLDRGFLFGDSVFEVLRTYGGEPFACDEHLARLERSARAMGFAVPATREEIAAEVREAIDACGAPECYVRVVVTRGQGALHIDPSTARSALRVVIASPLAPWPDGLHERGVEVATVRVGRATDHTRAAGSKVSAYVANMLALVTARERGGYEAMMVGEGGELSEGATSNLFVVCSGEVLTPPVSMGILPGITREFVIQAASQAGVPVRERVLFACDVERADEAFLTSSLREVVPIVAIDGARIAAGAPGPVTRRLHAGYRALVRARCGASSG